MTPAELLDIAESLDSESHRQKAMVLIHSNSLDIRFGDHNGTGAYFTELFLEAERRELHVDVLLAIYMSTSWRSIPYRDRFEVHVLAELIKKLGTKEAAEIMESCMWK